MWEPGLVLQLAWTIVLSPLPKGWFLRMHVAGMEGVQQGGVPSLEAVGSSSGEADTENSSDGSDTDTVSIADITGDFGASLSLEHSFPAHMQPPLPLRPRCLSAGAPCRCIVLLSTRLQHTNISFGSAVIGACSSLPCLMPSCMQLSLYFKLIASIRLG